MSNDMKCPICQTVLDKALMNDKIRGCPKCRNMGNIELWQELIRTRKALETIRLHLMAAKGRFNLYDEYLVSGIDSPDARLIKEEIDRAIEQITALEQKD